MYDEIVDKYMQLRERKKQMKDEYEAQVAKVNDAMERIENHFLSKMQESGMESIKTRFGTVYKQVRASSTVADRELFMHYCQENDAWHLADIRAQPTAIKEFREEHEDIPPGINFTQHVVVNIRKS